MPGVESADISLYRARHGRQYQPLVGQPKTISAGEIEAAIDRMASGIRERHGVSAKLLILGIANGGVEVARRLAARLGELERHLALKVGTVDISFHRDDLSRNPIPKEFAATEIPGDVNGATIILVDDVLHSGRTLKAALDELFDHGRPAKVELATLVDRGGRRLPIAADYCGLTLTVADAEKVSVQLGERASATDKIVVEATASKPY
jgi:pyrimidine operon attenuation protein/uracil phosphoribosyltransferase